MKKLFFVAILMVASVGIFFAADVKKKDIDPEKIRMIEDFVERGYYIKRIYLNGEVEWRIKGDSWFQLDEEKFEYPYAMGVDIEFVRWEMSSDAKGNLIFTEKEGWKSGKGKK